MSDDFLNEKEGDHGGSDEEEQAPKKNSTSKSSIKAASNSDDPNEELVSYVHIDGEWEERKISLFGAVKSFISQLKIGQDLTKVSLPCVFCRPYSLLEEVAARNLVHLDILFKISDTKDPLDRMLCVIEWLISTARQEKFNHKPFNPVIGEVNCCKYEHNTDSKKDKDELPDITYLVIEQVVHHPPTSAIRIDNPKRQFSLEGTYTFTVQFNRNSVSVASDGSTTIKFGDEEYFLKKAMPDLMIRNVILGSKLVSWEGDLTIECKKTKYFGKFDLSTQGRTNVAKGGIYSLSESESEPLAFVKGKCGGPATWNYNIKHPRFADKLKDKKDKKKNKKELENDRELAAEPGKRKDIIPKYQTRGDQPDNSSYKTWDAVRQCIIANDMDKADLEKQKIEQRQRELLLGVKEKGEKFQPVYFKYNEESKKWEIRDTNWWKNYKG